MQREKSHTIFFTFYCLCKTKIRENCHESQTQGCVLSLFINQYLLCANWPSTKSSFLCTNENRTDSPQYFSAKICSQTSLPPYRVQALEAIVIMISVDDTTSHLQSYFIAFSKAFDRLFICTKIVGAELLMISSTGERKMKYFRPNENDKWFYTTFIYRKKTNINHAKKASGSMYCLSRENGKVIYIVAS